MSAKQRTKIGTTETEHTGSLAPSVDTITKVYMRGGSNAKTNADSV